jgi:hypothetical protein
MFNMDIITSSTEKANDQQLQESSHLDLSLQIKRIFEQKNEFSIDLYQMI